MAPSFEDPQVTLNRLYAARTDLLNGKLQNYSLGDRSITLFNLTELDDIIKRYESRLAGIIPIQADLSGIAHAPGFPED